MAHELRIGYKEERGQGAKEVREGEKGGERGGESEKEEEEEEM